MTPEDARRWLVTHAGSEEPLFLPGAVLSKLGPEDVPEATRVGVGIEKDGATHIEWSAYLVRVGDELHVEVDEVWTRKYWYAPLNLEHHQDILRRAIVVRQKSRGDVVLLHHEDDGAFIHLNYEIRGLPTKSLRAAWNTARNIADQLEEASHQLTDQIGMLVEGVIERVEGWGERDLAALVEQVETSVASDEKGRALEELVTRLFEGIDGLEATNRVRTETEEIDITLLNGCSSPRLSRERAYVLVECKNWSSRCGKNEFVIFEKKLSNRSRRCSLGVLVSWNGFAGTVTKEMLRSSQDEPLIVPLDGRAIRRAVRDNCFEEVFYAALEDAVMT